MKKRAIAFLLAAMLLVLCGCNSTQTTPGTTNAPAGVSANQAGGEMTPSGAPGVENNGGNVDANILEKNAGGSQSGAVSTPAGNAQTPAAGSDSSTPAAAAPASPMPTSPGSSPVDGSAVHPAGSSDYEAYMNMTQQEQQAFCDSFPTEEDFLAWYYEAKAAYDAEHPVVNAGNGKVDTNELHENDTPIG